MSGETRRACRDRGHHRFANLRGSIASDLLRIAHETIDPSIERLTTKRSLSLLLTPPGLAVALHRVAHWLDARGLAFLGRAVAWCNHTLHKVAITPESCLGPGLFLPHPAGVVFHGRAGSGAGLYTDCICGARPLSSSAPLEEAPLLEDNVLVGMHVAVLGAVRIGSGANLPVKLTILDDVPADAVAASRAMHHRVVSTPNFGNAE